MAIMAKKSVEIPVTSYTGKITRVAIASGENSDGKAVQYLNAFVQTGAKVEGWNGEMKLSMPAYLTQQSALGRLLNRLQIPFTFGKNFDEQTLVGHVVEFDTKRDGNFTVPILDSVVSVASPSEVADSDEDDTADDDVSDDES